MHVDKASKLGAGLAGGAAIVVLANLINMINKTGNPQGISELEFLYTASGFAILCSLYMIFGFICKELYRKMSYRVKVIAAYFLFNFDFSFVFASFEWI